MPLPDEPLPQIGDIVQRQIDLSYPILFNKSNKKLAFFKNGKYTEFRPSVNLTVVSKLEGIKYLASYPPDDTFIAVTSEGGLYKINGSKYELLGTVDTQPTALTSTEEGCIYLASEKNIFLLRIKSEADAELAEAQLTSQPFYESQGQIFKLLSISPWKQIISAERDPPLLRSLAEETALELDNKQAPGPIQHVWYGAIHNLLYVQTKDGLYSWRPQAEFEPIFEVSQLQGTEQINTFVILEKVKKALVFLESGKCLQLSLDNKTITLLAQLPVQVEQVLASRSERDLFLVVSDQTVQRISVSTFISQLKSKYFLDSESLILHSTPVSPVKEEETVSSSQVPPSSSSITPSPASSSATSSKGIPSPSVVFAPPSPASSDSPSSPSLSSISSSPTASPSTDVSTSLSSPFPPSPPSSSSSSSSISPTSTPPAASSPSTIAPPSSSLSEAPTAPPVSHSPQKLSEEERKAKLETELQLLRKLRGKGPILLALRGIAKELDHLEHVARIADYTDVNDLLLQLRDIEAKIKVIEERMAKDRDKTILDLKDPFSPAKKLLSVQEKVSSLHRHLDKIVEEHQAELQIEQQFPRITRECLLLEEQVRVFQPKVKQADLFQLIDLSTSLKQLTTRLERILQGVGQLEANKIVRTSFSDRLNELKTKTEEVQQKIETVQNTFFDKLENFLAAFPDPTKHMPEIRTALRLLRDRYRSFKVYLTDHAGSEDFTEKIDQVEAELRRISIKELDVAYSSYSEFKDLIESIKEEWHSVHDIIDEFRTKDAENQFAIDIRQDMMQIIEKRSEISRIARELARMTQEQLEESKKTLLEIKEWLDTLNPTALKELAIGAEMHDTLPLVDELAEIHAGTEEYLDEILSRLEEYKLHVQVMQTAETQAKVSLATLKETYEEIKPTLEKLESLSTEELGEIRKKLVQVLDRFSPENLADSLKVLRATARRNYRRQIEEFYYPLKEAEKRVSSLYHERKAAYFKEFENSLDTLIKSAKHLLETIKKIDSEHRLSLKELENVLDRLKVAEEFHVSLDLFHLETTAQESDNPANVAIVRELATLDTELFTIVMTLKEDIASKFKTSLEETLRDYLKDQDEKQAQEFINAVLSSLSLLYLDEIWKFTIRRSLLEKVLTDFEQLSLLAKQARELKKKELSHAVALLLTPILDAFIDIHEEMSKKLKEEREKEREAQRKLIEAMQHVSDQLAQLEEIRETILAFDQIEDIMEKQLKVKDLQEQMETIENQTEPAKLLPEAYQKKYFASIEKTKKQLEELVKRLEDEGILTPVDEISSALCPSCMGPVARDDEICPICGATIPTCALCNQKIFANSPMGNPTECQHQCGAVFHQLHLLQHLKHETTCPSCGKPLEATTYVVETALDRVKDDWLTNVYNSLRAAFQEEDLADWISQDLLLTSEDKHVLEIALSPLVRDARMQVVEEIREAIEVSKQDIIQGFADEAELVLQDLSKLSELEESIKAQLDEGLDLQQETRFLIDKISQTVTEKVRIYTNQPQTCECGTPVHATEEERIAVCSKCGMILLWTTS